MLARLFSIAFRHVGKPGNNVGSVIDGLGWLQNATGSKKGQKLQLLTLAFHGGA